MQVLMRRPNTPWLFGLMALAGFGIFGFATSVLMLGPSEVLGTRLSEMTCLQMAFTPERYSAVFLSFSEQQREAIVALLVPGDLVFAWGYGFLLSGLLGLLALRLPGGWQRWGALIMWSPLLASTFDCIEDVFLYTMAQQLVGNPQAVIAAALPMLASIAAILKYTALSVIPPLYGLAGIAKGVFSDRSFASWLVYILLGLLLISMLLKPIQDIPACF